MELPLQDLKALEEYCRPFLRGERHPETAVELMASRFIAYATGDIDYILNTHDPKTRWRADRKATENWSRKATFHALEVVKTERGQAGDDTGHVEFIARYLMDEADHTHHERSLFKRIDGRWYFMAGENVATPPVKRNAEKVGRNDPCSCGSGKKYKKCCGANAA